MATAQPHAHKTGNGHALPGVDLAPHRQNLKAALETIPKLRRNASLG